MHGGRRLSAERHDEPGLSGFTLARGGATLGCEILDVEEPTIIIIGHMHASKSLAIR